MIESFTMNGYTVPTAQVYHWGEMFALRDTFHSEGDDAFTVLIETSDSKTGQTATLFYVYRVTDVGELEEWLEDGVVAVPGLDLVDLPYFEDLEPDCDEIIGEDRIKMGEGHYRYIEVSALWSPRASKLEGALELH